MTGPGEPLRPPGPRTWPSTSRRCPTTSPGSRQSLRGLGPTARSVPRRGRRPPHRRRRQAAPPTLTLCAAYASTDRRRTAGAASRPTPSPARSPCELVHLGSLYHDDVIDEAETRRGVPSVNARWSNIVAILAGDFLLARASSLAASLGADVAGLLAATIGELCRGPGARAAAPLRRRPLRGGLRVGDRGQDRGAVRDVVSHRRHGRAASTTPRSTRSRASAATSACASRSSTTCSTSRRPTTRSASTPARTSSRASTRCR